MIEVLVLAENGTPPSWLVPVVAVVLGGGFLTGLAALLKVKFSAGEMNATAGQITVNAAEGVVKIYVDLLDEVRKDNKEMKARLATLEEQQQDLRVMQTRVRHLEEENAQLRSENASLRSENAALSRRITALEGDVSVIKTTVDGPLIEGQAP